MNVLVCWTDISGYMAACWRALRGREGVNLHVLAYDASEATEFRGSLMDGIDWTPLGAHERQSAEAMRGVVERNAPDVILISGWANPAYRQIPFQLPRGRRPVVIMAMDTPWRGSWRQRLARFAIGRYLRAMDAAWVPGERGWQFARRLGFREDRILRGVYGFDWAAATTAFGSRRANGAWPRRFLFVGRYVPEKGIDLLVEGYKGYRRRVDQPWELACCGIGPLAGSLASVPGVVDRGFRQPGALEAEMAGSGAIVAPSRYDPWNVAIVEAAASGLPILCSDACGASVELARTGRTGFIFPTDSADAVTHAMVQAHQEPQLADMGQTARTIAEEYRAERWAEKLVTFVDTLRKARA